jgi:hypothetical protein
MGLLSESPLHESHILGLSLFHIMKFILKQGQFEVNDQFSFLAGLLASEIKEGSPPGLLRRHLLGRPV